MVDELGDRADGTTVGPLHVRAGPHEPALRPARRRRRHVGRRHHPAAAARRRAAGLGPRVRPLRQRLPRGRGAGRPDRVLAAQPHAVLRAAAARGVAAVAGRRGVRRAGGRPPAAGRGHLALRPDARDRRHRDRPRPRRAAQPGGRAGARCPPTARPPSPSATTSSPSRSCRRCRPGSATPPDGRVVPVPPQPSTSDTRHHGALPRSPGTQARSRSPEAPRSRSSTWPDGLSNAPMTASG